jgi:hypothetical protein
VFDSDTILKEVKRKREIRVCEEYDFICGGYKKTEFI